MATVSRTINAEPEQVFAQLIDPWMYSGWVVGASHIRSADDGWPAPGTRLHHAVGSWPILIRDHTTVLEVQAPSRLVLQARAWPAGEARVELDVEPAPGGGTLVRMQEQPTHGPARWLHNPVLDVVLAKRNREALARLACIAENRATVAVPPIAEGQIDTAW